VLILKSQTHRYKYDIEDVSQTLTRGFRTRVNIEITRVDVLSVLCPVSVLSHSIESCGTS